MTRILPTLAMAFLMAGCATPQKDARILSLPDAAVVSYPTELRGTYIIRSGSDLRYCAEPVPDVALDTLQKFGASLGAKPPAGTELQGSLSSELSASVVQLAGRTQLVLLAREMLYRACELTLNHPGPESDKQALEMYRIVAGLVKDLGEADRVHAEAELLKASYADDSTSLCIESWRKASPGNSDALKLWLSKDPDQPSIPVFIHGKEYAAKRSAFLRQQNINCK